MLVKKILKNNKAFSLLEVSLAMGIIVIGILGVFSLVIQNVQVQSINKNYLIASMLAQEGIELVRNKRDSNWMDTDKPDWYEGITDGDNNFTVDFNNNGVFDFSVDDISSARLYLDSDNFYTHKSSGNTLTPFSRLISISDFTDKNGDLKEDVFKVSSRVEWEIQGKHFNYVAETLLYNWRGL